MKMREEGLCQCGCGHKTRDSSRRFLRGHNLKPFQLPGEKSPVWKGGRHKDGCGYFLIPAPDHPRANAKGYVPEHVLIAEKALGKPLPPGAEVHHVNRKRDDNTRGNHVICQDKAYHKFIERRGWALRACGHVGWRKCWICQNYSAPSNLYIGAKGWPIFHRKCHAERQRLRRLTLEVNP